MADAGRLYSDKHSSSKPTNLDEQRDDSLQVDMKGDSTNSATTLTHEDATPVDIKNNSKGLPTDTTTNSINISASELTMSSTTNETIVFSDKETHQGQTSVQVPPNNGIIGGGGSHVHDSDSGVSLSSSHSKPKVTHDWIDVLGNGNLLKKVLREGEGVSTRPMAQSRVRMKIRGSLPSGNVVDRHSSLEFVVGDGDVIQALDIIAPLMEKGETCQIKTNHKYAYGAVGRSPDIPPNSKLMFDLELLEVKQPLDFSTISIQELLHQLNKKRGRGNDLFQRKEFSLAVHSYSKAVQMITKFKEEQSIDDLPSELSDMWVRCLNNLAAAQLKVEMFNEALDSVNMVLKLEPDNVKALYRCGKVYLIKQDFDKAVDYLQKASTLDPDEKAIHAELQKALRKRDQSREQEKALYKRMMTPRSGQLTSSRTQSASAGATTNHSSWGWKYLLLGVGVALTAVGIGYLGIKYRK